MKRLLPAVLLLMCAAWAQTAAPSPNSTPSGPTQAWNVFTLPNPAVTPIWRTFAPADCVSNYDACADDNRFWEEWDFASDFGNAIGASFKAVAVQGQYQGVMMLMPLGDVTDTSSYFASNINLMYASAKKDGAGRKIEVVLFPKWKYGAEWCYLYASNAPSNHCPTVGTNVEAQAHQKLLELMDYVQTLSGGCTTPGTFNSWFAIWYGWTKSEFPYQGKKGQVLEAFWSTLPTSGAKSHCNLQASYVSWLDSGYGPSGSQYVDSPDVHSLQTYVAQNGKQLYVDTELYSQTQIQDYANAFANQTIITGFWGANDITTWAQGMCSQWKTASQPTRLGVWTFDDRDADPPYELYRSYINNGMAIVGSICAY